MSRLDRLLRPRSIAVIGGGVWCANVIEQCRKIGFSGDIWPVHPTKSEVSGVATYPSIEALPSAPDASFIGVNRNVTIEAVAVLSTAGAGGAICFASGFREAKSELEDGEHLEKALLSAAGDMPIIGPNCYGLLNMLDGAALWPDQHGAVRCDRGVAIITQSSNIAINLTMQKRGLPVAYVVTAGNQAQTGLAEIGQALLEDPRVTVLGLHVEGVGDLRAFEALARRAHELGKPIIALKIGRSDQAQAATISHTASLAGSDAGASALLARLGIGQAHDLSGFLETIKLLHVAGPLPSNRIASASCSGGEASLIADAAHNRLISFPDLTPEQSIGLRDALGPRVALANPLDYHTYIWGDEVAMTATFTALMHSDLSLGLVVLDFPRADRCESAEWNTVIEAVAATKEASGLPMGILASLPDTMPESVAAQLVERGIVPFSGMGAAMTAIEIAANLPEPILEPLFLAPPQAHGSILSEAEAKASLAQHGLRVPKSMRVTSPAAAAKAAEEIGFPVALKGEGIAHKTEAGAVDLNLLDSRAVTSAAEGMPTDHFLVEEMLTDVLAELLIGVTYDPAHGYVLTVAAGGTLTEILNDSQSLLVPASRVDIRTALGKLKIAPLLTGYRGAPPADMDAVLDAVDVIQSYVLANPVAEVEVNPLMVMADGAVAADALIRTGDKT
ncbi:acetate--CoA ligase family protein [Aliiroseovarius sp. F20344]|uniref:acetate--CoA ligase family protein n=1 Tax=Aliiroseovarius sp. F20344 TaxID=2926414 RepID=UPI001FF5A3F3|nr:acetate--CoA ligase family protein [Aliiroseovarius sp. F20344]MCK0143888.1 acetate--CoA ligase family protein [Aliiroseovarius sp. F20344]